MKSTLKTHELFIYGDIYSVSVARSDAVGLGTAIKAEKWRGRFPVVTLEFFMDIKFSAAHDPGVDSASNRNKYQEYFLRGYRRPVHRADNLTIFMYQVFRDLKASTFWNPQGLKQACTGVLFLYLCFT
jgi:hypothetical protein